MATATSPEERIARARSAIGKGVRYGLGQGGYHPRDALPTRTRAEQGDNEGKLVCDCSGFVAWCIGWSRAPRPPERKWWFESTRICADATGEQRAVERIDAPEPGCIVAYPDTRDPQGNTKQGHVALVTSVGPDGALRGVDCSSTRSKLTGEAISERSLDFMRKKQGVVYCRPR